VKDGALGEMKFNDWNNCLALGIDWEEKLKNKVGNILQIKNIKRAIYEDTPKLQHDGVDIRISFETIDIDVKTRKNYTLKFNDILLETKSVIEKNVAGWFYTTQAHIVAYVWLNPSETNLEDGYLIFMSQSLRQWFEETKHHFLVKIAHSQRNKQTWTTENVAVPIPFFPKGSIIRFNPYLDLTQQTKLHLERKG